MARQLAEAETRLTEVVNRVSKKNSPEHKALTLNGVKTAVRGEFYTQYSDGTSTPESLDAYIQARDETAKRINKQRERLFGLGGRRFRRADDAISEATQNLIDAKMSVDPTSPETYEKRIGKSHMEVDEQLLVAADAIDAQPDTSWKDTAVTPVRKLRQGVQQLISKGR
jgi:hypothetical protein